MTDKPLNTTTKNTFLEALRTDREDDCVYLAAQYQAIAPLPLLSRNLRKAVEDLESWIPQLFYTISEWDGPEGVPHPHVRVREISDVASGIHRNALELMKCLGRLRDVTNEVERRHWARYTAAPSSPRSENAPHKALESGE